MKFLLDSNLSHRVAQLLRDAGIDATHVRDHDLQHVTDLKILVFARQHSFVLVSEDTDFGELLARQRTVEPSFVLLRTYEPMTPDEQAAFSWQIFPGCAMTLSREPSWSSSGAGFECGDCRCCLRYPNSGTTSHLCVEGRDRVPVRAAVRHPRSTPPVEDRAHTVQGSVEGISLLRAIVRLGDERPDVALDPAHLARWRDHALARVGQPDAIAVLTDALNRLIPPSSAPRPHSM